MNDFSRFIADLKQLPRSVEQDLRSGLRQAAEPIAQDARNRASWSDRIPGAIEVRTRLTVNGTTVSIRVNAKKAPHARPFERGGRRGNFRHPVFADAKNETRDQWTWVPQRARPFLRPAAEANADQAAEQVLSVLDKAFRQHGWH